MAWPALRVSGGGFHPAPVRGGQKKKGGPVAPPHDYITLHLHIHHVTFTFAFTLHFITIHYIPIHYITITYITLHCIVIYMQWKPTGDHKTSVPHPRKSTDGQVVDKASPTGEFDTLCMPINDPRKKKIYIYI